MEERPPSNRRWPPRAVCPSIHLVIMVQWEGYPGTGLKENTAPEEYTQDQMEWISSSSVCTPHCVCVIELHLLLIMNISCMYPLVSVAVQCMSTRCSFIKTYISSCTDFCIFLYAFFHILSRKKNHTSRLMPVGNISICAIFWILDSENMLCDTFFPETSFIYSEKKKKKNLIHTGLKVIIVLLPK